MSLICQHFDAWVWAIPPHQSFLDPLLLTTKALRNRLSSLKSHLDTVAQNEGVSPKTLASYLLLLCSNEDLDLAVLRFAKR